MCARVVFDLKKSYPQIRNYLVIPYLTFNIAEPKYFDDIIYPEGFEKYHFKAAIPARNRYLVDNAAYALCYVTHGWGGAAQTLERAQKKGLTIINLGERNNGEIIYEKHFHKETIEEIEKDRINFVEAIGEDAEQAPSFDEIMKKIYSNVTYLVLPEREKMAQTFIETAIEISNDYELDIGD